MLDLIRRRREISRKQEELIEEDYPDFRYNYRLGVANGVVFNSGLSFFNRTTIVPVFLAGLGAPSILISLTSLFESMGWHLPQFFASKYVVHRRAKMPLYRNAAVVRLLGLLCTVGAAIAAGSPEARPFALPLFVLGFGTASIAGGFAGLVFMEILAKTCPKEKRGTYFGWRMMLSGVVGFYLGVGVIKPLFIHLPYARNYMASFAIGATLIAISFYIFLQQREPDQENVPPRRTLKVQFTKARRILLVDRRFRSFVIFRGLVMLWFAGLPFFMLFAKDRLGVGEEQIGLFISCEFAGAVVANLLWGYISNRIGNRALLVISTFLATLLSGAVILFDHGVLPAWMFGGIFFLSSAIDSGSGNGGVNYALEIVPEGERPTYIGLMNTLLACALFLAALAGGLRDLIGYTGLYAATGLIAVAALVMILRLPEPRRTAVARRVRRPAVSRP